jgi:hypothetical protein
MNDDRILALKIEDPDLKESAVRRGADEHRELVSDVLADRVSYRMLDVLVRSSVPARRLSYSHPDKIACLVWMSTSLVYRI